MFEQREIIFNLTPVSRVVSRDRLVVRTLRCGRSNPGSNPGPGIFLTTVISIVAKV